MTDLSLWFSIAVIALVTAALRFLPFWIWRGERKPPKTVEKLGKLLPSAVMGMLVVYCLKDSSLAEPSTFVPPLAASLTVVLLTLWKRNSLLSILGGTLCYMLLVQTVF